LAQANDPAWERSFEEALSFLPSVAGGISPPRSFGGPPYRKVSGGSIRGQTPKQAACLSGIGQWVIIGKAP